MITSLSRSFLFILIATLVSNPVWGSDKELTTDDEKMFYFLGTALSANLMPLQLSEEEVNLVVRGLREAIRGNAIDLDAQVYGERLNTVAQERMAVGAEQESASASAYVAAMAAEEGAIKTPSGIVILELTAGDGASPSADSVVKAHYHGTLRDGTVFDSSVERGEPFTSSLSSVIPCWREAIPMIKEGGKSKITCPPDLAYGNRGSGPVPAGAALTFEVELIEVVE